MYCKILGLILGLNFFNTQTVLNETAIQKIQQIQQPIEIIKVEKDSNSKEFAKRTNIKFRSNDGIDYFVEVFEKKQELLATRGKTCVGPSAYLVINTTSIEDIKLYLCSEERRLVVNLLNTWLLQNENISDLKIITIPLYKHKSLTIDSMKYKKDSVKLFIKLLSD